MLLRRLPVQQLDLGYRVEWTFGVLFGAMGALVRRGKRLVGNIQSKREE